MVGFLYGQTEYNLLRNALRITDYIKYAKEYGYKYISITDSNMYGNLKFYRECKKNDIKPIIGLEIKVFVQEPMEILGYALDMDGYRNLNRISTKVQENGNISIDELVNYKNGIKFIIPVSNNFFERIDILNIIKSKLNDVAIGLYSNNDFGKQVLKYAKDNGYEAYPLHQTLYLNEEDRDVCEALYKINGNFVTIDSNQSLLSVSELSTKFKGMDTLFSALDSLASKIEYSLEHIQVELPVYPNAIGSSCDYLKNLCYKGLEKRLNQNSHEDRNEYITRLNYELSIIDKMGYNDYFLIVWDFVKYAKKNNIMVGPGRGSAAGSLVSFCLGITNLDPIKYDLLFERFLNPERLSMPDIDMDFPDDKRDQVIEYVRDLYGKEHVCNISAYGTFQVKSSVRDLGRVLKFPSDRLDEIVKLASHSEDYSLLLEQFSDNIEVYNLLRIAKKIEGLPRHISTHAAGIILANDSLLNLIPLQPGLNGLYQSQLEASDLESIGLLKIDFLGIRNLTIIDNIVKEIPNMDNINISRIPLDDKKTYELLSKADTLGIFQLESDGMKKVLSKLKPNCFEDIVAVLALYRPGPMENIDDYVDRKNGAPYTYMHKDLEDILKSTYGIIIYQEQIMKIALKFAGYSLGEADLLRRAVSKKKEDVLIHERTHFVSKSIEKGYSQKDANDIYDYIVKFANYGFNRSHSVAYALVSYQMSYFKANYFEIFMSKILNNVIGSQRLMTEYINYAKQNGVRVVNPNINYSTKEFTQYKGVLIYPLQGILSIGSILANDIIEERNKNGLYKTFSDFKTRVPNISSRSLESLIYAGAFDSFKETKKSLIDSVDAKTDIIDKFLEDRILSLDEYEFDYLKKEEMNAIGINLKYNLFINIQKMVNYYKSQYIEQVNINSYAKIIATMENLKEIKTKNDDLMLVGNINDSRRTLDMVIFPEQYQNIRGFCQMNKLYIIEGKIDLNKRSNKPQIQINRIIDIK